MKILNFKNYHPKKVYLKWSFALFFAVSLLVLFGCENDAKIPDEIKNIPVDLQLKRFDLRFGEATADSLPKLEREFPYLFPEQYDADFWAKKINDTIQQELNSEVAAAYPDFDAELQDIELLYKYIKYYFPNTKFPTVVTVTSDVDYRHQVILRDSLLIIALDTYLGSDHPFYEGIQRYFSANFRREQIDVGVASAFAEKIITRTQGRRFLDEMIYQGKRLYLMERLLSLKAKNEVIGYTPEQYQWAQTNEVNIWTYFVDRELLFSTDSQLLARFINPAPFSKFYLEFDNESPPRLGRYIGWQIVKAYMENNKLPLQMLSRKSADEIFENAKYKPRK